MWSEQLTRRLPYHFLFMAIIACQFGIPAFGEPSATPPATTNSSPSPSSDLLARAMQAFNTFHLHNAEMLFMTALEQYGMPDEKLAKIEILHKLARTEELLAQYDQAEKNLAAAVVCSESIAGAEKDTALANSLAKLGALDLNLADYSSARVELEKCLKLAGNDKAKAGIKSKVLNTLAQLNLAEGNWQKARENADSGLSLTENTFGKRSLQYAEALNTSAMSHVFLGKEEEATTELSSALACADLAKKSPERESIRITSLTNLAQVYLGGQHPHEAMQAADRALGLSTGKFGEDNPITARCMFLEGLAYLQGRDPESAKKYLDISLAISKAKLPAGHPEICLTLYQLGLCALLQKDLIHAEAYCWEADHVKVGSASNIYIRECKRSFAEYFWNAGNLSAGFKLGGWKIASKQLQTIYTPIGRIARALLPSNHAQDNALEKFGSLIALSTFLLVSLGAVALFVWFTIRLKLFDGGAASASTCNILMNSSLKTVRPKGKFIPRTTSKPPGTSTIMDKYRGRSMEGTQNTWATWRH